MSSTITRPSEAVQLDPSSLLDPLGTHGGSGPVCLWNPADFDPASYLGDSHSTRSDLARFVIHKIIWANVFGTPDQNGFVPLKAAYLRAFFPDHRVHSWVMQRLIDGGAIVCDGHYVKGEKCFGYKLGPELAAMRQRRVPITDERLAGKVVRHRTEFPKTLKGVHRHLYDHLVTVEIDRDAATDLLFAEGFDWANETALEFIHAKEFHLKVCPYRRVHTNLTCLKREFRQFLSVRGQRLVNLDIRNSQPLIFASLLKRRFEFNPAQTVEPAPADVIQYVELVQAGRFYDHLMEESGIPAEARSDFKRGFFGRVFFCHNNQASKEAEMFEDLFPNVYEAIREAKKEDYTALAKSLQRAESDLMIDGVATRCMTDMPHVFIGTIHDSILTTPDYADAVKSLMEEEFHKVGLVPTIREEYA
jgi:hypothetical protein